jgi:predicted dehydrogenase
MYRLGAIGFAQMHINNLLDSFSQLPNVEWVACADTVPAVPSHSELGNTRRANLQRAQRVTGIPRVYADYREMLAQEQLDIVVFCPENAQHGEVAEAIARHGAHMLCEKPLSATLSEALRMARAARAHGVTLLVNWPTTWHPAIRAAKDLIDEGAIGEVWQVKWRNGASLGPLSYSTPQPSDAEKGAEWWHQAAAGGGALLDYCCYGASLAHWYLGEQATAAVGLQANLRSPYGDADDNSVLLVRFPHAMAILEATWTTWAAAVPTGPIVYGSCGTLVVTERGVELYTTRKATTPDRIVAGDPLPEGRRTPAEEMIHHLETGEPPHVTLGLEHNLEVMAILDAGLRSAAGGRLELVDNASWCIG